MGSLGYKVTGVWGAWAQGYLGYSKTGVWGNQVMGYLGCGVPGVQGYSGCGVTGVGGTSLQTLLQRSLPPPAQFCPAGLPRLCLGKGALLGPGSSPGFWQALGPVTSVPVQAFMGHPRPERSWLLLFGRVLCGGRAGEGRRRVKGGGRAASPPLPSLGSSIVVQPLGWFLGGREWG